MRFTIVQEDRNADLLMFNPETAKKMKIPMNNKVRLHYGLKSIELETAVSADLKGNEISIPHDVLTQLRIQLFNRYEIIVKEKDIFLGPFIGILIRKKKLSKINILRTFSKHYEQLGGVLVAFSIPYMDKHSQMIKGVIYNPETDQWVKAVFPYPSSIFRKISLSWNHYLYSLYVNRIINQRGFDKWMVHERLAMIQGIKEYLPATTLYRTQDDILYFLQQYDNIYIKPTAGYMGRRIIKISKEKDVFIVQRRKGKRKVKTYQMTNSELHSFLEENVVQEKYIIQQGINLMSHRNQLIDFRVIIAKNEYGNWHDFGMIAKYGRRKSIVSNISSGGAAEMGEITIKKMLGLTDDEVDKLRLKVSQIAVEVAKGMEKAFDVSYGDLSLDIGIDQDHRVWIIEVNGLGDHTIAIDAGNPELYHEIIRANLLYAKKIAGFIE